MGSESTTSATIVSANPLHDTARVEQDIRARLKRLDLAQKVRLLSGRDHWSTYPEPAIGLRSIVVSDGPVGIRGVHWSEDETSINTPSATAIAATFDPAVALEMGHVMGAEARRKGVDVVLGPVVNLQRSPYGGRHFEAFSEDPWLTAQTGVAMVRGIQAEGPATTVKHFIANEAETDRLSSNSVVGERVLREAYLIPFEAIVTQGRGLGVMSSYNRINGTLATDTPLLRDVLKDEWGFDGFVVSDWEAIRSVEDSGNAATDVAMPGPRTRWAAGLVEAVQAGRVSQEAVDDKVLRLLRLAARVGALHGIAPLVDPEGLEAPPLADAPHVREQLRRVAAMGTVLLRNEQSLLPLDPAALARVAVIGPAATSPRINGGGSAAVVPPEVTSPLEAIRQALPGVEITYAEGARPSSVVRALTAEHGRAPGGGGVVRVDFLDQAGAQVGSELRNRLDTLVYGMGYPAGVPGDRVASIRATTQITVTADGDQVLAAAGVGHARITVDGRLRVDEDLLPVNEDAVIGMSLPPQTLIDIPMLAGRPVDVVFDYTPTPNTVAALRLGFDTATPDADAMIAEAVRAARGADVAIVLVGTGPEDEAEGFDRTTLALRGRQDDLVRAVAVANPRTLVVVNAGAPVLLPWRHDVGAIVLPWFGGQEMGPALADVLTGAAEPCGRLPVTFPADEGEPLASPTPVDGDVVYGEGLDIGYRGFLRAGITPAYPFGHGLGYTSWELGTPSVRATQDGVRVTVGVTNTGSRAGRQVVQTYCSRPESAIVRPLVSYAGSVVVDLDPGHSVDAEVLVPWRVLEHWDVPAQAWSREPGPVVIQVGTSSADLSQPVSGVLL